VRAGTRPGTQRLGRDADRHERVQVEQPHLDVFDAALAQRMQRALAAPDQPLGPDRPVELVLDLQQAGRQLVVFAARIDDADRLVRRIRPGERLVQRSRVAVEPVVADGQAGLRRALVAQPAHAQRRAVRHVQRAGPQRLQPVVAAGDEAGTDRRRGAEEVQQQERVAPEVADQREVLLARDLRQRPVVVDAGDRLHAAAVAVRQADAVYALGASDVRRAVRPIGMFSSAGRCTHAGNPQHLVAASAR